jgi:hypothetical protein
VWRNASPTEPVVALGTNTGRTPVSACSEQAIIRVLNAVELSRFPHFSGLRNLQIELEPNSPSLPR